MPESDKTEHFEQQLAEHQNRLYGYVFSLLSGHSRAAEVLQETNMVLWRKFGAGSIGNWSLPTMPDSEFAIRNLNGSIDEFVIFAAALSADEILGMYENGKP